ncbi:Spy/CpxP family protein refolding chaperone [Maribellus sediminis]|uniref:Spy/CpxP family protein refolding chaperone n=1 Tax=Maribellus sediminis TaxID=2696285 RepID=UPI0014314561|nr:periplasmic heavy metal sensor [Maribellus sediminis]
MKIKFLTLALIAIFAIGSVNAQNAERGKRDLEKKGEMMKRHDLRAERIDNFFTEEQQEQMKALRLETAKQIKPLKNQLNELEARQQTLTTAEKADMDAIYQNIDKISELKADIQKIMAKQHQEVRSLLTEEQLIKFDAQKARMKDRPQDRFRGERPPRNDRG